MLQRTLICLCAAMLVTFASPSEAQNAAANGQRITPNFKDADITQVIEAVAAATGRNMIVDPRVRAQVTLLSSTPMTPDAFYEAFLALLQVHGFVAVPSGNTVKVIPDANARTLPGNDLPDRVSATSDEIVTQVVGVKNVSAAQLVAILRRMMRSMRLTLLARSLSTNMFDDGYAARCACCGIKDHRLPIERKAEA